MVEHAGSSLHMSLRKGKASRWVAKEVEHGGGDEREPNGTEQAPAFQPGPDGYGAVDAVSGSSRSADGVASWLNAAGRTCSIRSTGMIVRSSRTS